MESSHSCQSVDIYCSFSPDQRKERGQDRNGLCPLGAALVGKAVVYIVIKEGTMGRGKGKLGRSERVAWTYIHYQM